MNNTTSGQPRPEKKEGKFDGYFHHQIGDLLGVKKECNSEIATLEVHMGSEDIYAERAATRNHLWPVLEYLVEYYIKDEKVQKFILGAIEAYEEEGGDQ